MIDVHFDDALLVRIHRRVLSGRDLYRPIAPGVLDNGTPELANFPRGELLPEYPAEVRDLVNKIKCGDAFAWTHTHLLDGAGRITYASELLDKEGGEIDAFVDQIVFTAFYVRSFNNLIKRGANIGTLCLVVCLGMVHAEFEYGGRRAAFSLLKIYV